MGILDHLTRQAPNITTDAPPLPDALARDADRLRALAGAVDDADTDPAGGRIDLEPVFTVIDYCDARGNRTRRRITLRSIEQGSVAPVLRAICHERKALRSFRCDRIEWFLEDDGEAIAPDTFFAEVLAIDLDRIGEPETDESDLEIQFADDLREMIGSPLVVLVAAARADDEFHEAEAFAIRQFAEQSLEQMVKQGRLLDFPTGRTMDQLDRLIRRMRPTDDDIVTHFTRTCQLPAQSLNRFMRALEEVINADGRIDFAEEDFLDDLALYNPSFQWR